MTPPVVSLTHLLSEVVAAGCRNDDNLLFVWIRDGERLERAGERTGAGVGAGVGVDWEDRAGTREGREE